jgi:sugar phosphate isomerase/epimerase
MIGISTYAFTWRSHPSQAEPMTVHDMLDSTAMLGARVFQWCDHPDLEEGNLRQLDSVRRHANALDLVLETGTRGVDPGHLMAHLRRAERTGSPLVRSMLSDHHSRPTLNEAIEALRTVMPRFESAGITLALETYEQFTSADLVTVIEAVGSRSLGVCLDPSNSIGALEMPEDVVRRCAPHVVSHHVKDFAFSRLAGGVGFALAGAPLGEGLLDHPRVMDQLRAAGTAGVNRIIEHWLRPSPDLGETAKVEERWVRDSVTYLTEYDRRYGIDSSR